MSRSTALGFVSSALSLLTIITFAELSSAQKKTEAAWRTLTLERLSELSDTSQPLFRDTTTGKTIVLRCQDEGWGTVSLERVRGRFALDQELGLKTWPEVEKALKEQKEAYLKSNRLRAREIFVMDESGPKHPRDDLAFFGDAEKGFRFKFGKFDECSKVDTDSMKSGEICQVVLEVKDGAKKSGASGFARFKSVSCKAKSEVPASPDEAAAKTSGSGSNPKKQPVTR